MSTSLRSVDMIFLGLTIHYVYLLTIWHLYNVMYWNKAILFSILVIIISNRISGRWSMVVNRWQVQSRRRYVITWCLRDDYVYLILWRSAQCSWQAYTWDILRVGHGLLSAFAIATPSIIYFTMFLLYLYYRVLSTTPLLKTYSEQFNLVVKFWLT